MGRQYEQSLLTALTEKEETRVIDDLTVLVKHIPDCEIEGAMDPRLYQEMKKMATLMRFVPKGLMKLELNEKSVGRLRKMFNSVDSTPIVTEKIEKTKILVTATDGYEIPLYQYKSMTTLEDAPILYFIHGGGFFGGSPDVVEEALKLFVTNTNMIAFSVDYRLAPEYPYPIGHEDCYTVLKWIHEHAPIFGGNPNNIFVAGDSAGGNLTQYCTNKALDEDLNLVRGQMLLYPTVNMGGVRDEHVNFSKDKFEIYTKHEHVINMSLDMMTGMTDGLSEILGTHELMTKYLTPYMEVNPKMPPTFLTVGEHDFLKVETLAYGRKLHLAGVETKTVLYQGLGHAYIDKIGYYPQSEDCVHEMTKFILAHKE